MENLFIDSLAYVQAVFSIIRKENENGEKIIMGFRHP